MVIVERSGLRRPLTENEFANPTAEGLNTHLEYLKTLAESGLNRVDLAGNRISAFEGERALVEAIGGIQYTRGRANNAGITLDPNRLAYAEELLGKYPVIADHFRSGWSQ